MDMDEDHTFFVSWALWQQMTFVLAMGIVAVFLAGLVKLWWNTRLMKKQEIMDVEKKARLEEMRKTGLPLNRASDIPFGVRAIQSGVEVSGIWISRPVSPNGSNTAKVATSVTVVNLDAEKATDYSEDSKPAHPVANQAETTPPKHNPSNGSIFQRLNDAESTESSQTAAPPVSQFAAQPKRHMPRSGGVLNEDTLRSLEGHRNPAYHTYAPTSAPRNPRQPSQRSSVSSSGESMDSQPRSNRSASGRSYTSSRSSRLYTGRNPHENRGGYSAMIHAWQEEQRDPFGTPQQGTPARTNSGFSALSQVDSHRNSAHQHLAVPEPTFGPGDLHVNRTARRVNGGFEVLPAGTFGAAHQLSGNSGPRGMDQMDGLHDEVQAKNKLRKKSNPQLQEEDPRYIGYAS
ncbi:hypothetical protein QBC47DRAFT_162187 [Echria macrotheca]|uniref:Uncharacterized protein n=1 Tax=Echria macrotheca TaxID=438768 RepID=A0AAJ0F768_9PEZI|nr:hypothetical protein QBC47DRAFT_162187 [Echria macrotheca]